MDPSSASSSWRSRLTRRVTTRLGAFGVTALIGVGAVAPALQQCDPPATDTPHHDGADHHHHGADHHHHGPTTTTTTTAPTTTTTAPTPPSSQVEQVVMITNQRRAENGRALLTMNVALNNAAQGHSNYQASINTMTHTGAGGTNAGQRIAAAGYSWSAWGENVAYGYPDAASVMNAWMNSSGHRANILNGNFTEIGVGLAYTSDGRPYWTMVLARPR